MRARSEKLKRSINIIFNIMMPFFCACAFTLPRKKFSSLRPTKIFFNFFILTHFLSWAFGRCCSFLMKPMKFFLCSLDGSWLHNSWTAHNEYTVKIIITYHNSSSLFLQLSKKKKCVREMENILTEGEHLTFFRGGSFLK